MQLYLVSWDRSGCCLSDDSILTFYIRTPKLGVEIVGAAVAVIGTRFAPVAPHGELRGLGEHVGALLKFGRRTRQGAHFRQPASVRNRVLALGSDAARAPPPLAERRLFGVRSPQPHYHPLPNAFCQQRWCLLVFASPRSPDSGYLGSFSLLCQPHGGFGRLPASVTPIIPSTYCPRAATRYPMPAEIKRPAAPTQMLVGLTYKGDLVPEGIACMQSTSSHSYWTVLHPAPELRHGAHRRTATPIIHE